MAISPSPPARKGARGRALMGNPTLLLLDEPSVGLAHRLKIEIFQAIKAIQQAAGRLNPASGEIERTAEQSDEMASSHGWHGLSPPRAAGCHPQPSTAGQAGSWGQA